MKKTDIVLGAGLIVVAVILADAAWEFLFEDWIKAQLYPDATLKARESAWQDFLAILALVLTAVSVAVALTVLAQRRRAGEALRESEARFRAVVENSPAAIFLKDTEGRYLLANRKYRDWYQSDVLGKTIHDHFPKELADFFAATDREVVEARSARDYEYDVTHADGTTHTKLMVKFPILGDDGEPVAIGGISTDITSRKQAEAARQESEARLGAVIDNLPAVIYIRDREGCYLLTNKEFDRRHGIESGSAVGKTPHDLVSRQAADGYLALDRKVLESGEVLSREADMTYGDGATRTVLTAKFPILGDDGQAVAVGVVSTDITARKRAEEALRAAHDDLEKRVAERTAELRAEIAERKRAETTLRESETLWRAFLDHSPAAISLKDPQGRYILVNEQFAKQNGVSPAEVIGRNFRDVFPEETAESVSDHDRVVLETHAPEERELVIRRRDGRVNNVLSIKFPVLGDDGSVVGVGGISSNIDARKRAEEELQRAKEQAEAANRAKSEFLANMSHDLRTPMNAILGFGQLLEFDAKEPLSPQQREYVGFILQGGQNLLELVDGVLDLARIEAGKIVLAPTDVVLGDVIEENLPLVRQAAEKRGIELVNRCTARRLPRPRVDYTRFKQVLLNLLSNAVKYNRDGGTVTLDCRKTPAGMLRVSVADTGHGIPSELRDQVFRPFSRLEAETTGVEGTGLGLSICKRLVEAMGGEIGFESKIGQGTTFWVDLPVARKRPAGKGRRKGPVGPSPKGPRTVLYVADELTDKRLMEAIVRRLPDTTLLSADGARRGLGLAAKHGPDVILMDANPRDMSGTEALERLRRYEKTRATPVIAMSTEVGPGTVREGRRAGFQRTVAKPIDADEVVAAIKDVFAKSP